jgi:mRNA interferase MazF
MKKSRQAASQSATSSNAYCPDAGDIIWIDFDPQVGREQAKRRPALVLTPASYNGRVSLCVLCPITSTVKNYPFVVALPPGGKIAGVVLADQIKSFSWVGRNSEFACVAPNGVLVEVKAKIRALIQL